MSNNQWSGNDQPQPQPGQGNQPYGQPGYGGQPPAGYAGQQPHHAPRILVIVRGRLQGLNCGDARDRMQPFWPYPTCAH